jgi:hypothetical protein
LITADDGRILGCQAIGSPKAVELVNIAAAALASGMKVEDIAWLDLAYAPPYSPVWHPLLVLANQAVKKINLMKDQWGPSFLFNFLPADAN